MTFNKIRFLKKNQTYLAPLAGSVLGFLLGISGVTNDLMFERSENLLKTKVTTEITQATELGFAGFRILLLAYVGLSAGLVTSRTLSRQKSHQNK